MGTFHSTPVMGGADEGLGVALAVGLRVGLALTAFELVLEGEAPTEIVGVAVGVAVRGQQAAAEVEPVELVVKPAPQGVHVESPVVAA